MTALIQRTYVRHCLEGFMTALIQRSVSSTLPEGESFPGCIEKRRSLNTRMVLFTLGISSKRMVTRAVPREHSSEVTPEAMVVAHGDWPVCLTSEANLRQQKAS